MPNRLLEPRAWRHLERAMARTRCVPAGWDLRYVDLMDDRIVLSFEGETILTLDRDASGIGPAIRYSVTPALETLTGTLLNMIFYIAHADDAEQARLREKRQRDACALRESRLTRAFVEAQGKFSAPDSCA